MKVSRAIRAAWKTYTASPAGTLRFLLVEACLTLICLAPSLLLSRKELAWGACAAPVLWILVMLPARMNAAADLRAALRGGTLGSRRLADTENYGGKLLCGLKRLFFLLLWAAPLIALTVVGWIHFSGEVDSFTVLRMIRNDLGSGDQLRGILVLVLLLVASLLILAAGCAFHSGARHAFAAGRMDLVRGHHGKIMLTWLASLLSILPLLIAVAAVILRYLPVLSDLNGLLMRTVSLPSTRGTGMILLAGAVLTLPLLPLRSLIHAAFVAGLEKEQ